MDPPPPPRQQKPKFIVGGGVSTRKPASVRSDLHGQQDTAPTFRQAPRFSTQRPTAGPQSLASWRPKFTTEPSEDATTGLKYTEESSVDSTSEIDRKRRRLDDGFDNREATQPERQPAPRFLVSHGQSEQDIGGSKPSFLRSSVTSHRLDDPLPEIFSPHRRGQRFVPGGVASELQAWILDMGNTAAQARRRQSDDKGPEHSAVLEVESVRGEDVLFIEGSTRDGNVLPAVLAEKRDPRTGELIKVHAGDIVAIREPAWGLQLEGDQHLIGVDWHILK